MPNRREPVKIAVAQMACKKKHADNQARAESLIESAARAGAKIICLQELFSSPYFCQSESQEPFDFAETFPGPTTERMAAIALQHGVVLIVPFFEKRTSGVYHNSAAIIDADGSTLGIYRKMHIPDDPGFLEKYYFAPGDLGFRSWDTAFGKIGVCICWDQWFPEAARLTALSGAEILFFPTAIGWLPSEKESLGFRQHDSWETIQRSHGIANGCFVAVANRTGFEPGGDSGEGIEFWGQSFVSHPDGGVIGKLPSDSEEMLIVEVNLDDSKRRRSEWPFFRDRRVDAYGDLGQLSIDQPPIA